MAGKVRSCLEGRQEHLDEVERVGMDKEGNRPHAKMAQPSERTMLYRRLLVREMSVMPRAVSICSNMRKRTSSGRVASVGFGSVMTKFS